MADLGGLQTIGTTLQNLVQNIGQLTKQVATSTSAIFPQTQGTATTATAGSIASPGSFAGFIEVQLPNGNTAKIPFFNP